MVEGRHRGELLKLINKTITQPRLGAEVGVKVGKNALGLLLAYPQLYLHLVDLWARAEDKDSTILRTQMYGERWEIHHGKSTEMAEFVPDGLDFVFIDADHSYENCLADMIAYFPKVREGGLFSGHDYRKPNTFPGVDRAVAEFTKQTGVEFNEAPGNIWWAIKPGLEKTTT